MTTRKLIYDEYHNRTEATEAIKDFIKVSFEDDVQDRYGNLSIVASIVSDKITQAKRVQIEIEWSE